MSKRGNEHIRHLEKLESRIQETRRLINRSDAKISELQSTISAAAESIQAIRGITAHLKGGKKAVR